MRYTDRTKLADWTDWPAGDEKGTQKKRTEDGGRERYLDSFRTGDSFVSRARK